MNAEHAMNDADPAGRTSVDEVRRPGRHRRPVLRGQARRDHRADRPERRRQDHGVQLHHRLLQADGRHDHARPRRDGSSYLLERLPDYQITGAGQGGAHLPEHPPVLRHDGAGKPAGRPAQQADEGLGLYGARPARLRRLPQGVGRIDRAGQVTGWRRPISSTAPTIRPAICPMARSAAWKSRAPCAPSRNCCASTSRRPASIRKESLALNALLIDIKNTSGTSILLIEHDMSVVMQISDHVVVLEYGRKISDGNPHIGEDRSARHRRLSRRRRRGGRRRADRGRRRSR